jgi:hypothetical protein
MLSLHCLCHLHKLIVKLIAMNQKNEQSLNQYHLFLNQVNLRVIFRQNFPNLFAYFKPRFDGFDIQALKVDYHMQF